MHTGDMGLTIPLMTVPGRGGVGYPISLGYSAGIQVQSSASWVGLGWDLGVGSISRSVVGIPDDYNEDRVENRVGNNLYWYDKNPHEVQYTETEVQKDMARSILSIGLSVLAIAAAIPSGGTSLAAAGYSQTAIAVMTASKYASMASSGYSAVSTMFNPIITGYKVKYRVARIPNNPTAQDANGFLKAFATIDNQQEQVSNDIIFPDSFFASTPIYSGPLIYGNQMDDTGNLVLLHAKQSIGELRDFFDDDTDCGEAEDEGHFNNCRDSIAIRYNKNRNTKEIDSFTIIGVDGTSYRFESPVKRAYNDGNQEFVNLGSEMEENNAKGVSLSKTTKRPNADGQCHFEEDYNYMERVEKHSYNLMWGLTEINAVNGDNKINFVYSVWSPIKHLINPHPVTGYECIESPDGTMAYSELFYQDKSLDMIISDTHVAIFHKEDRDDAMSYNNVRSPLLRAITLHHRIGDGEGRELSYDEEALSTIYFDYEYELMEGYPNGEDSTHNRLTLKKVYFFGEEENPAIFLNENFDPNDYCRDNPNNCLPPYEFEYGFNPQWGLKRFDRWGFYYENGRTLFHNSRGFLNIGSRPDAWSLTKIRFPEGGTMEWEYEPDDYTFVNNVVANPVDDGEYPSPKYGGGLRVKSVKKCPREEIIGRECIIKEYDYTGESPYSSGVATSEPGTYEYKQTSLLSGSSYSPAYVEYSEITEDLGPVGYIVSEFTTAKDYPNEGVYYPPIWFKSNRVGNEYYYGFSFPRDASRRITLPRKGVIIGPRGNTLWLIIKFYDEPGRGYLYTEVQIPDENNCNAPEDEPGYACAEFDLQNLRFGTHCAEEIDHNREDCLEDSDGTRWCPMLYDITQIEDMCNDQGGANRADLQFYVYGWRRWEGYWNNNGVNSWRAKCRYDDATSRCVQNENMESLECTDIPTENECERQENCYWEDDNDYCSSGGFAPSCSIYQQNECGYPIRDSYLECIDLDRNFQCDLIQDWRGEDGDIENNQKYTGAVDRRYEQGLLLNSKQYDSGGNLISEIIKEYEYDPFTPDEQNHFPTGSWTRTKSTSQTVDSVTTETEFEYDSLTGLPKKVTMTNSNNKQLVTETGYAYEITDRTANNNLRENHRWSDVQYIKKEEKENQNDAEPIVKHYSESCYITSGNNYLLGGTVTCIDPQNECEEKNRNNLFNEDCTYDNDERNKVILSRFEDYDIFGNLLRGIDNDNKIYNFFYGDNNDRVNNGGESYDNHHAYLTAVEDPLGNIIQAEYNSHGQVKKIYGINNEKTEYEFDSFGRLKETHLPDENGEPEETPSAEYEYHYGLDEDLDYNFVQVKQNNDNYETILRSFTDGLGRNIQTQAQEDDNNWIVSGTNEYEENTGRLIKTYKSVRKDTDGEYKSPSDLSNLWNNLLQIELPYTKIEYWDDPLGRVKKISPPGENGYDTSTFVQTEYDNEDENYFKTTVTEVGTGQERITRRTKSYTDKFGNFVKLIDASDQVWNYEYDILGRLLKVKDPTNREEREIKTEYDALGRVTYNSHPDTGITYNYVYDNNNNLKEFKTYPVGSNGNEVKNGNVNTIGHYNFDYDEINRKVYDKFNDQIKISYYYDGNDGDNKNCLSNNNYPIGKLCSVFKGDALNEDDLLGTTESYRRFGYDNRGRLTEEQVSIKKENEFLNYNIVYEYDKINNLKEEKISGGDIEGEYTIAYTYDALNRLIDVKFKKGDEETTIASGFNYNPTGTIESFVQGNDIETSYDYTPRDWLKKLGIGIPDIQNDLLEEGQQEPFQRSYEYDKIGNLESLYNSLNFNDKLAEYQYDPLDRLTNVENFGYYPTTYGFTYDAVGNRQTQTNEQNRIIYDYNDINNQLITITEEGRDSTATIEYDGVGNTETITTSEGTNRYIYDYFNNMMKGVDLGNDGQIDENYIYDSSNKRIKKSEGENKVTYYLYDQFGNMIYEFCDGSGCTPIEKQGNKFVIEDYRGNDIAYIYENGIMFIKGRLQEEWSNPDSNDFIINNVQNQPIAWIDDATGNLYLQGELKENTEEQTSPNKNEFIIQNSMGEGIAWFDEQGNLYLKQILAQEYNEFNQ